MYWFFSRKEKLSGPAFIEHFSYVGLFVLLVLGAIGLPFPEGTTLIVCGVLIFTHVIKSVPALLIAYSGILIGDLLAYSLGRKYGRMIVTHKRFHRIISPERLLKLENMFNKKRTLLVMIGGHLIGEIFIVAGVMRMPLSKFLAADAIASIFTIAIWTGIGYVGGNSLEVIKKDITRIEHIGILFVIILLAIYLIYRYFKSQRDKTLL
jgi:membrane protein DedA with SNARE-associated domain